MRGTVLGLIAVFALVAATGASVSADTSMSSSSPMSSSSMSYLTGSWNCSVKISAMMGNPATTDHGVLSFSTTPNHTLHSHITAADYSNDGYYGYNAKTKTHWNASVDTEGVLVWETSKDGKIFLGTSASNGTMTPTRDTFAHPSAKTITDLTEIETGGKWSTLADATCTKM